MIFFPTHSMLNIISKCLSLLDHHIGKRHDMYKV